MSRDQRRLLQLVVVDLLGPVARDDVGDPVELRLVDQEARIDRRRDRRRRAAAGRPGRRHWPSTGARRRPRPGGSGRCRRGAARSSATPTASRALRSGTISVVSPVGRRHQLGVEQIGADRVGERHVGRRHLDIFEARHQPLARGDQRVLVGEGLLVREQHALVGDGDDVIVERAGGDRFLAIARRRSSRSGSSRCSRAIALRRLDMLARRERRRPTRHRRRSRRPARRAPAQAACGWPRPRRRTPAAPGRGPRRRRSRTRAAAAPASPAIRGCGAAWSAGWRRSGGICRRPCRAPGETVAALAAHIAEADMALAASAGSARSIVVPSSASQARSGRGCGRKMPCARPSARLARILSMPCSAAARGCDTCAGIARRGEVAEAEARHNCGSARRSRRN